MRRLTFSLLLGLAAASTSLPAAAQSTVRVEPRPFYGATVTMEEGVRVFRPLPAHERVIINPNNATPINIEVGETQARRLQDNRRR